MYDHLKVLHNSIKQNPVTGSKKKIAKKKSNSIRNPWDASHVNPNQPNLLSKDTSKETVASIYMNNPLNPLKKQIESKRNSSNNLNKHHK